MKTFITSDLHLNHANILKYCPARRNHKDLPLEGSSEYAQMIDQMNQTIINRWNSIIGPGDKVWILGDVAMGQIKFAPALIRQLNGQKFLVKGNHDKTLARQPGIETLFQGIYDYKEISHTVDDKKHMLVLSHYPLASWNGMNMGSIMAHGHLHGSHCAVTGRIKDVGMDTNDLMPYLLDDVIREMVKIEMIRDHHNKEM